MAFDDNYEPGAGDNFAVKQACASSMEIWKTLKRKPNLWKWSDGFPKHKGSFVSPGPGPYAGWASGHTISREEMDALHHSYDAVSSVYYEFPPVWHGTSRFAPTSINKMWHKYTSRPLLSKTEAAAFAAKHGLKLAGEARRYTHLLYNRVHLPT